MAPSIRIVLLAVGVTAALVQAAFFGKVLRPFLADTPLADIRYGVSLAVNLFDLLIFAAIIVAFGGAARPSLLKLTGLAAPVGRPALFALLLFGPAAAIAYWAAPIAQDFKADDLAMKGVVFPIIEEIGFRGMALGALMILCGWRFLPAAILPAAIFGLAHFWQGQSPAEIAGVVAITALGGLVFGWLFVRWGFNLWPPIALHVGLNSLWLVFNLGENAIGGWLGNALRVGVIAGAIGLTLLMAPKPAPR